MGWLRPRRPELGGSHSFSRSRSRSFSLKRHQQRLLFHPRGVTTLPGLLSHNRRFHHDTHVIGELGEPGSQVGQFRVFEESRRAAHPDGEQRVKLDEGGQERETTKLTARVEPFLLVRYVKDTIQNHLQGAERALNLRVHAGTLLYHVVGVRIAARRPRGREPRVADGWHPARYGGEGGW